MFIERARELKEKLFPEEFKGVYLPIYTSLAAAGIIWVVGVVDFYSRENRLPPRLAMMNPRCATSFVYPFDIPEVEKNRMSSFERFIVEGRVGRVRLVVGSSNQYLAVKPAATEVADKYGFELDYLVRDRKDVLASGDLDETCSHLYLVFPNSFLKANNRS